MARLTSPFPDHHTSCPDALANLPVALLLGIFDGDGTISFARRANGAVQPKVTVASRDDDATPFAFALGLTHARGAPLGWLRRRAELRRNEWVVDDPAEVLEFATWLTAAQPLAPRTLSVLGPVVQAASILVGADGVPSPDATHELARMAGPARHLARNAAPLPAPSSLTAASDDRLGWELAGLLSSDGYLALRNRAARFAPVASISQRTDNEVLLKLLRERLGLGDLVVQGRQVSLRITRHEDLRRLIALLRTHPIPPAAPRRRQFEIWAGAVALRGTRPSRDPEIVAVCDALRRAKRYAGPRLLCSCQAPG